MSLKTNFRQSSCPRCAEVLSKFRNSYEGESKVATSRPAIFRMTANSWSDRLARAYACVRGVMIVSFSVLLVAAPEKAMPGSATEPARSLAQVFASRSILLGVVFVVLALRRARVGLAWVFWADGALQLFDTGMAVATNKGALAILPAALGALDIWAGLFLLRAARMSSASPA
jgi:hypothetical protein